MDSYPYAPIIDGDILVYRCGFACKDHEPESHARYSTKRQLESIIDRFDRGLSYRLFLTGDGNYRALLAKEQEYKGNRKKQPKPKHYQAIRDYMTEHWKAEIIEGREADDALGCAQTDETCIVSIDKDLDMIPGAHWNFVKDRFYLMDDEGATRAFYTQLLVGDRIDNIPGIHGIGPKKAEKILKDKRDEISMQNAVLSEYKKAYGAKAISLLNERGSLLWIQRKPGEIWSI